MSNEQLQNDLIDKIAGLDDPQLLQDLHRIVDELRLRPNGGKLSPEELFMLRKSDEDIAAGRLISEEEIQSEEDQWLSEQPESLKSKY